MTELQIGLIGFGAVAVAGVAAHNTWQEYRQRKLVEDVLKKQHADVLLDADGGMPASAGGSDAGEDDASGPSPMPETVRANERIEPVWGADDGQEEATIREEAPPAGPETPLLEAEAPRRPPVAEMPAQPPQALPAADPEPEPEPASEPEAPVAAASCAEDKRAREVPEPHHMLSPAVDYIAAFEAVEPSPADHILGLQRDTLARIRKPVHWIGYNERQREWEPIIDDGESEYRSVRVGLQLVDRQEPVSDAELSMFHVAMQDVSHALMAIADLPSRQPALETAIKLDEFCAGVDIQIGINVVAREQAFPGTKLRALAEAAGMVINADGRFVRCDDEGCVLYLLLNQEAAGFAPEAMKTLTTHGLTFLLDVPTVAHGERVFSQMVDLAKRFADVLHGAVVDDNRRPLAEAGLSQIRRQVGQFQSTMAANGLPAGGSLTRRLFS